MIKFSTPTFGKKDAPGFLPADLKKNFAAYTGRKSRTDEQIAEMVNSLLAGGQKVPITVRRGFNGEAIPVTGHTRILAADIINSKGLRGYRINPDTGEKTEIQYSAETPFILTGLYNAMNELDAIFASFIENADRTALNDMDYALFIQVVSESTSMSDAAIAEKLGKKASYVSRLRTVLELDAETQKQLSNGTLKLDAALTAAKIEPSKRAAAVANAAAAAPNGKATASGIAKAAAALGAVTAKPMKRTDADVKNFIDKRLKQDAVSPFTQFLFGLKDFRAGVIDEAALDALADALQGVEVE